MDQGEQSVFLDAMDSASSGDSHEADMAGKGSIKLKLELNFVLHLLSLTGILPTKTHGRWHNGTDKPFHHYATFAIPLHPGNSLRDRTTSLAL